MVFCQRQVPYYRGRRHDGDTRYGCWALRALILNPTAEFPQEPTGALKQHIADEANARMAYHLPIPEATDAPSNVDIPERPKLPEGTVDAPLVRLYNFLRE